MASGEWVLGRIFGPAEDKVTGSWRELLDMELHNFTGQRLS